MPTSLRDTNHHVRDKDAARSYAEDLLRSVHDVERNQLFERHNEQTAALGNMIRPLANEKAREYVQKHRRFQTWKAAKVDVPTEWEAFVQSVNAQSVVEVLGRILGLVVLYALARMVMNALF